MEKRVARVAVSAASFAFDKLYDYLIPEELREAAAPGMRVSVPFSRSNRRVEGVIVELAEQSEYAAPKPIDALLDPEPVLTEEQLRLARWMKARFFCTIYEAVRAMLPAGLWIREETLCLVDSGVDKEAAYAAAGEDGAMRELLDALYASGGRGNLEVLQSVFGSRGKAALKALEEAGVVKLGLSGRRRSKEKTAAVAALALSAEEAALEAEKREKRAPMQAAVLRLLAELGPVDEKELRYFTGASASVLTALKKAGLVETEQREVFRTPELRPSEKPRITALNEEQETAFRGLLELLDREEAAAALLYGVTGSGKTAVYIRLIAETIARGKAAVVLVPEIALTPQLTSTFQAHFGKRVAVLHSSLSVGERSDEWRRIRLGQVDVVVGTRSAVFAPVEKLGLLILDEEQEGSYKSENAPRYHARDVAKYLCVQAKALLLLGSATPSVETMYEARSGRIALFRMEKRYNRMALPRVLIADLRRELRGGMAGSVSSTLAEELEKNFEAGEQSILFLNRRGSSAMVACPDCGSALRCPNCSANLTYHAANGRLMCHYCGFSRPLDRTCPDCGSPLCFFGSGTQRVEEELKELYPGLGVTRMDTDSVSASRTHEQILSEFEKEKIPVLVGTQMVAKGLNLENVTLVGVVSADQMLYSDDYRARERCFSLITQVVGRSGRGEKAGRAVIQTFTPDNEVIRSAARQDYDSFYEEEIGLRQLLKLPPFSALYVIRVSGGREEQVLACCRELRAALAASVPEGEPLEVLGPAPAHVLKVNNRYRYRVFLRCPPGPRVRALTAAAIRRFASDRRWRELTIYGDVDPME